MARRRDGGSGRWLLVVIVLVVAGTVYWWTTSSSRQPAEPIELTPTGQGTAEPVPLQPAQASDDAAPGQAPAGQRPPTDNAIIQAEQAIAAGKLLDARRLLSAAFDPARPTQAMQQAAKNLERLADDTRKYTDVEYAYLEAETESDPFFYVSMYQI